MDGAGEGLSSNRRTCGEDRDTTSSEIRRYFLGPFVPNPLLRPRLLPLVPRTDRLVFQAVHADDVADAYRRVIAEREVRGAFNIAADPVLDSDALAEVLEARAVPVPARLRGHEVRTGVGSRP